MALFRPCHERKMNPLELSFPISDDELGQFGTDNIDLIHRIQLYGIPPDGCLFYILKLHGVDECQ
jgi:hypothetical protein